jgi:hypothetical protein
LDLIIEGLVRPAPLVQLIHWQRTGGVRELKWYEHVVERNHHNSYSAVVLEDFFNQLLIHRSPEVIYHTININGYWIIEKQNK